MRGGLIYVLVCLIGIVSDEFRGWRRPGDISGELAKVLRRCGQQDFVSCTGQSSQPKPIQFEYPFHVGEGHLDLFTFIAGASEGWRLS